MKLVKLAGALARCTALPCAALFLASCTTAGFDTPVALVPAETVVMPSGVRIQDELVGSGPPAVEGTLVSVHYVGTLEDGEVFDSSRDQGPLSFTIGAGEVIPGWEQGMTGMRQGGRRRITIPPELAYGSKGREGAIPPDATIVLEVELLEVFAP